MARCAGDQSSLCAKYRTFQTAILTVHTRAVPGRTVRRSRENPGYNGLKPFDKEYPATFLTFRKGVIARMRFERYQNDVSPKKKKKKKVKETTGNVRGRSRS